MATTTYDISSRWKTVRKQLPNYLFILPHLLFLLFFLAGPVLFGLYISFHSWNVLNPEKPFVGLENYRALLHDQLFIGSIGNTLYFAVLTVALDTVCGLLLALMVNQRFPLRLWIRVIVFAPVVVSVATQGIIWQWLLNTDWGFINYVLSLVGIGKINWLGNTSLVLPSISISTVWWGVGFVMIFYLAGLQNIPEHLYEAGKIDGANEFLLFRHITLPLLLPTTLFVLVTGFIGQLQVFGQVYVMTQGGPDYASSTIVMWIYNDGFRYYRMGYAAAMAFALAAGILIVTLIQMRLFGRRIEL